MDILLQDLYYGVRVLTARAAFTVVATLACIVPAIRAARIDPMTALRYE